MPAPTPQDEPTRTAAELLREIAERDPEAHRRALGRAYGCGPTLDGDAARLVLVAETRAERAEAELSEVRQGLEWQAARAKAAEADLSEARAAITRVEALAEEMSKQHGQCWNSIFARRVRVALASSTASGMNQFPEYGRAREQCNDVERACREQWPEAWPGDYHPSCCRFPKSCSANVCDREYGHDGDHEDSDVHSQNPSRRWKD